MSWWRRVVGRVPVAETLSAEMRIETNWRPPVHGERSPDGRKVYLEGGPPGDPHALWTGPFPPAGHREPAASAGLDATVAHGEVLRRARVIEVSPRRLVVCLEYKRGRVGFTKRSDGAWREEGLKGHEAPRLVLGIGASNFRRFKKWYTDEEMRRGWELE